MVARSQEIEDRIIAGLEGGKTLNQICLERGMPTRRAINYWLRDDPDFASKVERARLDGYEVIAEQTLDIIDERPEVVKTKDGSRIDAGFVQWAKNRAEFRLKLLGKWHRERYGDKADLSIGNREGEALKTEIDGGALAVELAKAMRALKSGEGDGHDEG